MKHLDLNELFLDELQDMYDAENQIIESLPLMIKSASSADLKEALTKHLKETEGQVKRLEEIFSIMGKPIKGKKCDAMAGILKEAEKLISNKSKSQVLDAAIICAGQKVEHYEMATYGSLHSFAKHLELDSSIPYLIQQNLDEEGAADKKLTKLAEGSIFSSGINREAADKTATSKTKH